MDYSCYMQNEARRPFIPVQPSSRSRNDISFPMLKEHLTDVINEHVSVSNRRKINSLVVKFDAEATNAHRLMQQAQEDMITAPTDCFNAIHGVLAKNDNADVVDNDKNQDERQDAEVQVVNDNMQQTSNTTTEDPLPCDVVDNNRTQDE
jgi:hypothetical protein